MLIQGKTEGKSMSTPSVPPIPTSPRDVAIVLHQAFEGVDMVRVVDILAQHDATQRALIQQEYGVIYPDDILSRLSSKPSGKLETAVLLWMYDPVGRDAIVVKWGLSSETENLRAATEVICSCTPSQIQCLKQQYHSRFGAPLEHDIKMHTSGDHKELLLAYVCTPRDEGLEVDPKIFVKDSEALGKAGEKKLRIDEKTFIHIFSKRSSAQLATYHDIYGNLLEEAVKKGKKKELFKFALLTILFCSKNRARYFAEVLHKAMKLWRTDDTTLIRVIVTRTGIDMQCIKDEYLKKYNKTLNDAVHSNTSDHFRTFLLSLLGPNC